jgi:hypothetical protein
VSSQEEACAAAIDALVRHYRDRDPAVLRRDLEALLRDEGTGSVFAAGKIIARARHCSLHLAMGEHLAVRYGRLLSGRPGRERGDEGD